jgi:hypothetical protein
MLNSLDDIVGVVSFVRQNYIRRDRFKKKCTLCAVIDVATGQNKMDRSALSIYDSVDFGGRATARRSNILVALFFLAPAECW